MKKTGSLLVVVISTLIITLNAQTRYLDEVFDMTDVQSEIVYGNNISVLSGTPAPLDLMMDVYTPIGDTETSRPLVIYLHTGSFLTLGLTGSKTDSAVVEMAKNLARRGFVAVALSYRQGWSATSPDPEVRKATLLKAYFRSVQDTRTAIRFFRKTIAEDGNPYGIDGDKIALIGQGTGGYVVYGCAGVNTPTDIEWPELLSAEGTTYIDLNVMGDIYGTNDTELCNPNWLGYSSDFSIGMNMGGACGTTNWFDAETPPLLGLHVPSDPFAPYECDGDVIVPATGDYVITVDGTKCAISYCNEQGINDVLTDGVYFNDPYTERAIQASTDSDHPYGIPNLFPLHRPTAESGPWEFWDTLYWSYFSCVGGMPGQTMNDCGFISNPDMSPEKARAYIDTAVNFFLPRAMVVMQLPGYEQFITGIEDAPLETALSTFPNPANDYINVRFADTDMKIETITISDITGKLLARKSGLSYQMMEVPVYNFPPGMYLLEIASNKGKIIRKITIE